MTAQLDEQWRTRAACRDAKITDGIGPWDEGAHPTDVQYALIVCVKDCPVYDACEAYAALHKPDGGVWAGRIVKSRKVKESA